MKLATISNHDIDLAGPSPLVTSLEANGGSSRVGIRFLMESLVAAFGRLLSLEAIDATLSVVTYMTISLWGTFLATTWVAISLPLLGIVTLSACVDDSFITRWLELEGVGYFFPQQCNDFALGRLPMTILSPYMVGM